MKLVIILIELLHFIAGQFVLDSPIDHVYWCGGSVIVTQDDDVVDQQNEDKIHRKVLFGFSNRGIAYRSTDYGVKWENVTLSLIQSQQYQLDAHYKFKDVLQSPNDSHVMYFIGFNASFITTDCGRTYKKFTDNKLFGFRFNKMNTNQILAFSEKKCDKQLKSCKELYKKQLWVTTNGGIDWKVVLEHVREAAWDKLIHYEMVPDQRIIVTHVDQEGMLKVSFSDDFFKSIRVIQQDCFGFYQTTTYLFLLVRPDQFSVGYDLMMSPHLGDSYFPQEIVLPLDDQSKHTFTVLDVSDSIVYLSVAHSEELSKLTNVYMSDGNEFTVALLGNVRSQDTGHCDFEKIKSMRGVYISNIFDNEEVERTKSRRKRVNSEKDFKSQNTDRLDQYKKSVITYDFGGEWHPLKAPKYTYDGQPLQCSGDCSLHLKGRTETQSMIYSSGEAVGIIIGTGNTGLYLNSKETNTYLSRDGGHNWFEILKGSHIYEIGDHGGLIVFADSEQPTNIIKFTWDEGLTFQEIKLKKTLEIENIVTEPSNQELKFIVYGRVTTDNQQEESSDFFNQFDSLKGVIIPLDFSTFHQRQCQGSDNPGDDDSDYEYWTPMNYMQQKCLFGQKIKYQRKKREAKCKNADVEKKIIVEKCPCTEEDWECDIGYARKINGGECLPMTQGFQLQSKEIECVGTYMRSQGYRKIPSDECEGGVYLGLVETECPIKKANATINPIVEDAPIETPIPKPIKASKSHRHQQHLQQPIDQSTSLWESISSNKEYVVIGCALVIIYIFRHLIMVGLMAIRNATTAPKSLSNRGGYYPPNEEEMAERRKKMPKLRYDMELLTSKEEDEEAGL